MSTEEKCRDFVLDKRRSPHDALLKLHQSRYARRVSAWKPISWTSGQLRSHNNSSSSSSTYKSQRNTNEEKLLILGQGTVEIYQALPQAFEIKAFNSTKNAYKYSILLTVNSIEAEIKILDMKNNIVDSVKSAKSDARLHDKGGSYTYWLSIDDHNNTIRYGAGELRLANCKLEWSLSTSKIRGDDFVSNMIKSIANIDTVSYEADSSSFATLSLMKSLSTIRNIVTSRYAFGGATATVDGGDLFLLRIWRDPVIVEPAIKVVSRNDVTMEDISLNTLTVIDNLPIACQRLYWNVCGEKIVLNDSEFPQFSQAIEQSISNENGWCYKKLVEKSKGHGGADGDPAPGTYLRITLGVATGNSPGCPFVMEIWPPKHFSPIHNHADAYAIIRVLYGEVEVSLYPHLSEHYKEPTKKEIFKKNEVTYILPGLNQTHQVYNPSNKKTCVTLQCYQYGDDNNEHYEYFDYLDPTAQDIINQFEPKSDCDFVKFKQIIAEEYQQSQKQKGERFFVNFQGGRGRQRRTQQKFTRSDTVAQLKEYIARVEVGGDPDNVQLKYRARNLSDNVCVVFAFKFSTTEKYVWYDCLTNKQKTLGFYGIDDKSCIMCIFRVMGGCFVN